MHVRTQGNFALNICSFLSLLDLVSFSDFSFILYHFCRMFLFFSRSLLFIFQCCCNHIVLHRKKRNHVAKLQLQLQFYCTEFSLTGNMVNAMSHYEIESSDKLISWKFKILLFKLAFKSALYLLIIIYTQTQNRQYSQLWVNRQKGLKRCS